MKIAVLHRYPPRQVIGTNASFIQFLDNLSDNGHQIYYLTYKDRSGQASLRINNLKFVYLPFFFNRGNHCDKIVKTYLWIILAPLFVLFLQLKYHLDLVYCDDSVPFYGFLSKLLSPRSRVIIRLGDLQTGYALADKHSKLFKLALKVETFMWQKVDGLIAISEPFRKFIIAWGIKPKKVGVVEESINLMGPKLATSQYNPKKLVTFLFHGSLETCKGLEVLLRAFVQVQKKHPDVRLIIAGGGSQEKSIRKIIKTEKIANIDMTGWYDLATLNKIMSRVDISIVMRSNNLANNFVVTTCLLENWAHSKPIIAPNLDAFEGVVKNGVNGILFTAGDSHDLAEKMIYLLDHPLKAKALAIAGRQTAKKLFDHRTIAAKMVKTLDSFV